MANYFATQKSEEGYEIPKFEPEHMLTAGITTGAGLKVLRELREKIENIELRILEIEKKINERIPERVLSESRFSQEIRSGDEIIEKIISEVRGIVDKRPQADFQKESMPKRVNSDQLSKVEGKNIEKIVAFLRQHKKLSATQLSQLMFMSRTRCSEYFKKMEDIGLVRGGLTGKEKYYYLI